MTTTAILEIFSLIDIYYLEQKKARTSEEQAERVKAWGYALSDIPDALGKTVFLEYVRTNHFPPHVSDLITRAREMKGDTTDETVEGYVDESMRAIRGDIKLS